MRRRVANPPNPWQQTQVEWLEEPPEVELEIREVEARSILSKNDSPDIGFTYSLNPYQGCYHGCAYCYARPSHQYAGFGAGTDFERKLLVKTNAPTLLRDHLMRRSWTGETIVFSGNTDCYQPLEARYALTRACLEVCLEFRNPIGLITKGGVVHRDVDLLAALAREASAHAFISIAFSDDETRRALEPFAAPIERRFEALKRLSEQGVPTGIALAPVIPGLNDSHIPELLERAKEAGARQAFITLLRLPAEVKDVFFERVATTLHPKRVEKIASALREMRGGELYDRRFGNRMHGEGKRWELIEQLFRKHCLRLGLNQGDITEQLSTYRRPTAQLRLLD